MTSSTIAHFDFDLAIYRLAAIKKAAYRFAGEFEVSIEGLSDNRVRVALTRRNANGRLSVPDFPREVLDQDLREQIAEETAGIRDILLAHTFSELPLTDAVGETADFRDDPLGIGASQSSIRKSQLEG